MIYFDNASTVPPFKEAIDSFASVSEKTFGNPNSTHLFGLQAKRALEEARAEVLSLLGLSSTHQCIFLSGASEANSMAIKAVGLHYASRGKRIITSAVEHPSVSEAFKQMGERFGFEPVFLGVNHNGVVSPSLLEEKMGKDVVLVSFMQVNNETGAIFPLEEYSSIIKRYPKAFFHVDATQGIAKVDASYSSCDLISFSSHKFGGMKGSGALIYRKNIKFAPLVSGGEQEFGYRGGTVAVPLAVSTALALKMALAKQKENERKVASLCAKLESGLRQIDGVAINSPAHHSPYLCNFSLLHHKASVITEALSEKGIFVSSVSACSSKGERVSHVLLAMGKSQREAANSIRVSFNANNTEEEVSSFLSALQGLLKEIKTI